MTLRKLPTLLFLAALCAFSSLRAADDSQLPAVTAADDARVSATIQANREQLETILAPELRYGHASGAVDTKATLIDALTAGRLKYVSFKYEERNFSFPSPEIALMTGRVKVEVATTAGSTPNSLTLGFLAVWKHEGTAWHFLAWQSCKLPAPQAP